jgi:hypothetical protein
MRQDRGWRSADLKAPVCTSHKRDRNASTSRHPRRFGVRAPAFAVVLRRCVLPLAKRLGFDLFFA